MAQDRDVVVSAIERWVSKGLLPSDIADRLIHEVEEEGARTGQRVAQYALAVTGALVLVVAVAMLGDWLWPMLGTGTRSMAITAIGVAVHSGGRVAEDRVRWRPAGYLLQTAGLLVLLGAFTYSAEAWSDGSLGGVLVGGLALATPLFTAPRALKREPFMAAVHLATGLGFMAVFLNRATPLSGDSIVWILDALLLVLSAAIVVELTKAESEQMVNRALYAFLSALVAGLALVLITGAGPLNLSGGVVWAVDAWLLLVLAMTLWGLHAAPARIRRGWFNDLVGGLLMFAIPMAFWTADELNGGTELGSFLVGLIGAGGLTYGIRLSCNPALRSGALAVVIAAWWFGVDQGGAIGAVVALVFTAGVLFWLSSRVPSEPE